MSITLQEKTAFLQSLPFIKGLDTEVVRTLAERARVINLEPGKHIYSQGDQARAFVLVYAGQVRLWYQEGRQEVEYATLLDGHELGQEELLNNIPYRYFATTEKPTTLLWISPQDFEWLLGKHAQAEIRLRYLIKARHMAARQAVDWLEEDEVVRFAAQRHPVELLRSLLMPAAVIAIGALVWSLLFMALGLGQIAFFVSGMIVSLGSLGLVWQMYDFQNDQFIITNLRVVWVEEVLIFGSSRQETMLSSIQSVETKSNFFGNLLGFGDLMIRTFTSLGNLLLTSVSRPDFFKDVIYAEQARAEHRSHEDLTDTMRQKVRQKLGLETSLPSSTSGEPQAKNIDQPFTSLWNPFTTRVVEGDQIIYRKHWLVLLRKTLLPVLGFAALLLLDGLLFYARSVQPMSLPLPTFDNLLFINVLVGLLLAFLLWYRYTDYRNDMYIITPQMIVDSEKKPLLGSLITKTAPISNIQSTRVEQKGIMRNLFNFGTLQINVADQRLDFIDVYDPQLVMHDLTSMRNQQHKMEKAARSQSELERVGEMIGIYHRTQQEGNTAGYDDDLDFEEPY